MTTAGDWRNAASFDAHSTFAGVGGATPSSSLRVFVVPVSPKCAAHLCGRVFHEGRCRRLTAGAHTQETHIVDLDLGFGKCCQLDAGDDYWRVMVAAFFALEVFEDEHG